MSCVKAANDTRDNSTLDSGRPFRLLPLLRDFAAPCENGFFSHGAAKPQSEIGSAALLWPDFCPSHASDRQVWVVRQSNKEK